jgi:hypothetical protein
MPKLFRAINAPKVVVERDTLALKNFDAELLQVNIR